VIAKSQGKAVGKETSTAQTVGMERFNLEAK
jgi:hypothetical protein